MKLDVCIIATVRPEILRMTLASFCNKFLHQFDCRAIINVDSAGDTAKYTQQDVVAIAQEFFHKVVANTPATPGFAAAVKWCWRRVATDLFFHLEDDWILKRAVAADELLAPLQTENATQVVLNKYAKQRQLQAIAESLFPLEMSGDFIKLPYVSLNPTLMRGAYANELAAAMDVSKDPEGQFIKCYTTKSYPAPVNLWRHADEVLILDTGHDWRRAQGLKKHSTDPTKPDWYPHARKHDPRLILRRLRYRRRKKMWLKYCQPLHPNNKI